MSSSVPVRGSPLTRPLGLFVTARSMPAARKLYGSLLQVNTAQERH